MVYREDFGLEAGDYCFMDLCFKLQAVDNFIHLCELSQLMAQILKFQAQSGYANDMGRINCIHTMDLFQVTQQYKEVEPIVRDLGQSLDWRTGYLTAG